MCFTAVKILRYALCVYAYAIGSLLSNGRFLSQFKTVFCENKCADTTEGGYDLVPVSFIVKEYAP